MSQNDLIQWFIKQRETGNDSFYSMSEIAKHFKECNQISTNRKVVKLYAYGYLDVNVKNWRRYFRIKEKYVSEKPKEPLKLQFQ